MQYKKQAITLFSLLALLLPGISNADVKIITGAPYYKHNSKPYYYNRNPYSYNKRGNYNYANGYYKRHNFANRFRSYNPYLNNSYSYDKIKKKRCYDNSLNLKNRYNYGYKPYSPARNVYKKGYNRGYRDGYNRSYNKGFKMGK